MNLNTIISLPWVSKAKNQKKSIPFVGLLIILQLDDSCPNTRESINIKLKQKNKILEKELKKHGSPVSFNFHRYSLSNE
jgi:hypothetical protein